jgi:pyruvate/2-oxoacid:ferredoxin oxidoreductase beta subunit
MNTGVQRSSATPLGAWTTTTPSQHVKEQPKKDLLAIMAAHGIPYAATATVAYPDDLKNKIAKALAVHGTRFLHLLSPCPPGWKISSEQAIEYARLAVAAHVFPLVEVEHGRTWRMTVQPDPEPLEKYLDGQGRFRALLGDAAAVERVRQSVEDRWQRIVALTRAH